ncbi:MAG TPA: hypothetical protein VKA48_06970 [Gammaproteobacteria bacterium]|nr:hypothetical protein [Gammaproteobacteria bacterium]
MLSDYMVLKSLYHGESVSDMRQRFLSELSCDAQEFCDRVASLLERGLLESSGEGLCISREGMVLLADLEEEHAEEAAPQSPSRTP